MKNFEVIIEHDFFSKKPIVISFNMKVVHRSTGKVLHSMTFKHRSLDYGLWEMERYKKFMLQPRVLLSLMAADMAKSRGIKFETQDDVRNFVEGIVNQYKTGGFNL